jgi:peptidoglycan hydrolase-like protein with peptidoglycan-binding domain
MRDREPAAWAQALLDSIRLPCQAAASALLRHRPVDTFAFVGALAACVVIVINAVVLQSGSHPAPFFANPAPRTSVANPTRTDLTTLPRPSADVIADIQRELFRRGLYEGGIDGIYGPRTDAAIREFEQRIGKRPGALPTEALLRAIQQSALKPVRSIGTATPVSTGSATRNDPIAQLIGPSARISAVQRVLADYGYGQIKPSGAIDRETQAAIEKFERAHKLPISGQISERLVKEIVAMTGRPLD